MNKFTKSEQAMLNVKNQHFAQALSIWNTDAWRRWRQGTTEGSRTSLMYRLLLRLTAILSHWDCPWNTASPQIITIGVRTISRWMKHSEKRRSPVQRLIRTRPYPYPKLKQNSQKKDMRVIIYVDKHIVAAGFNGFPWGESSTEELMHGVR